jgi:hypothetical protein
MRPILERFKGQLVILHMAANWRIVGTVMKEEDGIVELVSEDGAPIFVSLASIAAIEPYRVRGESGHYI